MFTVNFSGVPMSSFWEHITVGQKALEDTLIEPTPLLPKTSQSFLGCFSTKEDC